MDRCTQGTSITHIRLKPMESPIGPFLTYTNKFIWFKLKCRGLRLIFIQGTIILL